MTGDEAAAIAVGVLSYIAEDPRLLERFAAVTGLDLSSLRSAAATPGFLPSVLDFVLAHEPTLRGFASATATPPENLAIAREVLAPADIDRS